jgi:hypothetical protein
VVRQQVQVVMIAFLEAEEAGSSTLIVLRDVPRNVEQVRQLIGTDALLNIPEEAVVPPCDRLGQVFTCVQRNMLAVCR